MDNVEREPRPDVEAEGEADKGKEQEDNQEHTSHPATGDKEDDLSAQDPNNLEFEFELRKTLSPVVSYPSAIKTLPEQTPSSPSLHASDGGLSLSSPELFEADHADVLSGGFARRRSSNYLEGLSDEALFFLAGDEHMLDLINSSSSD